MIFAILRRYLSLDNFDSVSDIPTRHLEFNLT